jgi:hypothetical protein
MILNRHLWLVAAVLLCSFAGCGGSARPAKKKPSDATAAKTTRDSKSKAVEATVAPPEVTKPVPAVNLEEDSAAAAILRTLQALEAGDLAKAYDFLPPKYQADVDSLVHEFAERMDEDLWLKLVATARKSLELLRTKKKQILELDLFGRSEADPYRKHWDSTLELLTSFANSDAASLEKLKLVDVKSLLPGKSTSPSALKSLDAFGLALGANLAKQFEGVTVTPVRTEGDVQIVALRGPNDDKPTEIAYVKQDGRWLPKSLIDQWPIGIAADREWLAKLPERILVVKPKLLDALVQTDEMLDRMLAANNREEFEQAAGPAILSLAMAWPNLRQLAQQAVAGQSETPPITISINRELTESELNKLVETILKPLRDSGCDYTLLANDGRTTCRLLRVTDVESLRKNLATHFLLKDDNVGFDQDASTIKVDLAQ